MDKEKAKELKYHCEQIGKLLKEDSAGANKDLYLGEKFLIEQFKEKVHPEIGEVFFAKEKIKDEK
jgi:hypothetical protein